MADADVIGKKTPAPTGVGKVVCVVWRSPNKTAPPPNQSILQPPPSGVEPSTPKRGPAPTKVAFCTVLKTPVPPGVVATDPLAVSLARRSATRRPSFHWAL